jgi:hypothetical protein
MNKALLEARKKFANQKTKMQNSGGFDNSNWAEGKYTCDIIKSEIVDREDKNTGEEIPKFVICVKAVVGECKGRTKFPFPPSMTDLDGITRAAQIIRIILGDVVPGRTLPSGEFELDVDKFLLNCEALASQCNGKTVEIQVKNSKKKKEDGTFWQNVYINRALGDDAKGVDRDEEGTDELPFKKTPTKKKKPTPKKRVAKKKATKKR